MEQQMSKEKIDKIMSAALFKFSIKCLRVYMNIKPKGNYVFSPYNTYEALFSVYLTSSGTIEQRLKHILYLTDVSKYDLIDTVNFDKYFSNSTNSASTSHDVPLEATEPLAAHDFENESILSIEDNINASLENLHLEMNEAACDYEGKSMCWIRGSKFSASPERMKKIFKDEFIVLEGETRVNVFGINLKIEEEPWKLKKYIYYSLQLTPRNYNIDIVMTSLLRFNKQDFQRSTTPEPGASSKSTVSDKRKRKNFFCDELDALISEFPYENGNASLFMLIPASWTSRTDHIKIHCTNSKLCNLVEQLSSDVGMRKLRELLNNNKNKNNIDNFSYWPVFEMEKNLKFRKLLQALGVGQLLTSNAINLDTYFTRDEQFVCYGNVAHRTHVKITKKNTWAGAMTLFTEQEFDSKVSKVVRTNSKFPFVWLIYDKRQRDILFIGACRGSIFGTGNSPSKKFSSELFKMIQLKKRPRKTDGIRMRRKLSSESNTSNTRPAKRLLETDL